VLRQAYGQSRYWVSKVWGQSESTPDGQLSVPQLLVAGAATGLSAGIVESPIDLLKAKLQMQYQHGSEAVGSGSRYRGTFDCARSLLRSEGGFRNLYQGFDATLSRNLIGSAIYFASYDLIRRRISALGGGDLHAGHVITAGGLAGVAFWTSIYPFDTVKSLMQTEPTDRALRRYATVHTAFRTVIREQGFRALVGEGSGERVGCGVVWRGEGRGGEGREREFESSRGHTSDGVVWCGLPLRSVLPRLRLTVS
jgi:Mitochondrial carrier protein